MELEVKDERFLGVWGTPQHYLVVKTGGEGEVAQNLRQTEPSILFAARDLDESRDVGLSLNQEQVAALLPHLQCFAETGRLAPEEGENGG